MSTGVLGNGATLQISTSTITELTSIGLPGLSADDLDVTTHNDTDKVRQFVKGLIDAGEVSFEGNVNYTDYAAVYAQAVTTSSYTVTITLPTSPSVTKFECYGYVKGLEGEAPHDDLINFSGSLKISGKPILTQV